MTKSNYKLTKEDFKQINRRSLFTFQLGWNYERMQGSGYLYTILPQLRKIYGDDTPELKEVMKTHTQFFNTSNFFNTIITGIDLAIEESVIAKFRSVLSELSDQQRQVMNLSLEGLKVREIAQLLEVSENTVKMQKKRAYAYLRERMGMVWGILLHSLFSDFF